MIVVHGYMGEVSTRLRDDVARATLVVGGLRHLDAAGVPEAKRVVLGRLSAGVEALRNLGDDEFAVVIASGDPLFFGVGRTLRREGLRFDTVPAPSSVAVAFARIGVPWDDAVVVSAHGRELDDVVAACQEHPKVAAMTSKGHEVAELARDLAGLERRFVVCERLGEHDERVREVSVAEAAELSDVAEPAIVLVLADEALVEGPKVAFAARARSEQTEPIVGQLTNSPASRRHADAIDAGLGIASRRYDGPAKPQLARAWAECDLLISHLALGATTRLVAPLLADKHTDPGVVVVDEAGRFAIPLVGGHAGGANDLAGRVADILGATPVLTTATDALNVPALDTLGWPYRGDVAGVTQAILNERPVLLVKDQPWPLPPLPANVSVDAVEPAARIVVTDRIAEPFLAEGIPTVVLHPASLVVGIGCNSGTDVEHLREHVFATLATEGLARESVCAITTHEVKAGELGLIQLVAELGVRLVPYPADVLAACEVPTPSATVASHVGTPSVSEASVLAHGADLLVPKRKSSDATCAVGRIPARGKLYVVGIGPGARDLLTPRAKEAIRRANLLVGYGPYVRQVRDLARPGCEIHASKMGTEEERTALAIARARAGDYVALVCSGDPSIYAMGSPVLEQGTDGIDVDMVPGVTAALAISSILGAPLGHDNVTLSLSDLHTPWAVIENRLEAAAKGDFVVSLYNPRSRTRVMHLPRALEILGHHRPANTPVAVVRQATRPQQSVRMTTLAEFDPAWVDMNSMVVIGSSTTRFVTTGGGEERMVTPRDYTWMENP